MATSPTEGPLQGRSELGELRRTLRHLATLFESLLQTRRWRVGNAIGNSVERFARAPGTPKAVEQIREILAPFRPSHAESSRAEGRTGPGLWAAWLKELCFHLPLLLSTRRWRLGVKMLRPLRRITGRSASVCEERIHDLVRRGRELAGTGQVRDHRAEVVVSDLFREIDLVLRSPEWRTGKLVGDLVERIAPGPQGEKSEDHLRAALAEYREWLAARPGVSAQQDRERANRVYQEHLKTIEAPWTRQLSARAWTLPTVRAVVLQPHGQRQHHAALEERLAAVSTITVLTDGSGKPPGTHSPEIETLRLAANDDLIEVLNAGLERWEEDYIVILLPSDHPSEWLRPALAEHAAGRSEPAVAVVFDHDRVENDGRRVDPAFKPGFSPELLLEHDYIGRSVAFHRKSLLARDGFEAPACFTIRASLLRLFDEGGGIAKLDRVLLHLDATIQPQAPSTGGEAELIERVLARRGLLGHAEIRQLACGPEVRFQLSHSTLVSIIIPFTDRVDLLRQCVDSVLRLTTHPRFEIVLVDTRSREEETLQYLEKVSRRGDVRVVQLDEKFNFSRACNSGAEAANGGCLVFLNNDTKLLTPDWLQQLCGYARVEGMGAVGAKLLFPDGSIQHAGVVVGMTGFANHVFSGEHEPFLPATWLRYTRNVSAVTAACLAIDRQKFLDVGGFDERLTLTGNDVDLCLRLMKRGLRTVVLPTVKLFHFEKATRCRGSVAEHNKRLSLLTYRTVLSNGDPYFNSNLSLSTTSLVPRTCSAPAPGRSSTPADDGGPGRTAGNDVVARSRSFLALYDLSSQELEANRELNCRFHMNRRVDLDSVLWFVPHFDHVYRGGIHTIMRIADHFTRRADTLNRLVFFGRGQGDLGGMDAQIQKVFPGMRREMILLKPGDSEADLPASDVAFCTLWTSAYHLARYNRCRGKFYLAQDFEGGFSRENSVSALAEQTYRLGFVGITNTPGVCEMYRSYGNEAEYFIPAVDLSIFSPARLQPPEDVTRIIVYGRPDKPRNAFALAAESLRELKRRHGDRLEILSVGAEFDVRDYGLEDVLVNLGLLPDMHVVASLYRQSHIGLVFMLSSHPSYQPFEYMASGCAVVTNFNEANTWFLKDRHNALVVPPLKTRVVEAIEELMGDKELRARLITNGLDSVSQMSWDEELDVILRWVSEGQPRTRMNAAEA